MSPEVARIAATLLINELFPRLKRRGIAIKDSPIPPIEIALAAYLKHAGVIDTAYIRRSMDEILGS